jgi:hypothetical protein
MDTAPRKVVDLLSSHALPHTAIDLMAGIEDLLVFL